jgi:hypothetical protein
MMEDMIKECWAFLKSHGGSDNGYDTKLEGEVRHNVFQYLEWRTPESDSLTGEQVNRESYALNSRLLKILSKYFPDYNDARSIQIDIHSRRSSVDPDNIYIRVYQAHDLRWEGRTLLDKGRKRSRTYDASKHK